MNKFSPFQHRGSLPCNVCLHEQVARGRVVGAGISLREIERRTGLSALLYNVIVFMVT
jgi:hypothetical protein